MRCSGGGGGGGSRYIGSASPQKLTVSHFSVVHVILSGMLHEMHAICIIMHDCVDTSPKLDS